MMQLRASVALLLVITFAPNVAGAQCVMMPLHYYLSEDRIAVIFRGTVGDVKTVSAGQIVTFDVDRVWKGRVSKTTIINNLNIGWSEEQTFVVGERRVVMAHRQSAEERSRFGNAAKDALGTHLCGGLQADSGLTENVIGNAKGYGPRPDPK